MTMDPTPKDGESVAISVESWVSHTRLGVEICQVESSCAKRDGIARVSITGPIDAKILIRQLSLRFGLTEKTED